VPVVLSSAARFKSSSATNIAWMLQARDEIAGKGRNCGKEAGNGRVISELVRVADVSVQPRLKGLSALTEDLLNRRTVFGGRLILGGIHWQQH
jgi:hypothetical protein